MNEATQRLLPATLLTLALHSAFLSWQVENRPIELPKPEKISVSLRKPPPPPPQQKIVKELPPPPELNPVEHKPLETLPPPQHRVARRMLPPPSVAPAALRPLETLPPAQARTVRALPPPPDITAAAAPQPPAQSRVFRQLPRLPPNLAAVSQPSLRPLETLPPLPEPALVVWEEPVVQQEAVLEEVVEEEIVETEPVYEEIVEEYTPPVEYVEAVEEQVWEVPPPRRIQRQRVQQERRRWQSDYAPQPSRRQQAESSHASHGAGDREAAPLYASNPPPNYPAQARRRGLQGMVIIEALIDASGGVADLRLSASSGHSILDQAALDAVRGWRFQPGTIGGRRKQMWVKVPVRFELN